MPAVTRRTARGLALALGLVALAPAALAFDTHVPGSDANPDDARNAHQHFDAPWDSEHRAMAFASLRRLGALAYGNGRSSLNDGFYHNLGVSANNDAPCTQRPARQLPGVVPRTTRGGFCVVDLNSWSSLRSDRHFERRRASDAPDTPLEERYLPESDHAAELPDALYSVYDFVDKASHCVPEPNVENQFNGAFDDTMDFVAANRGCHRFLVWMGALNSNHFGSQAYATWRRYHRVALAAAARAAALRAALAPRLAEHPEYRDVIEEAEREALTFEGGAQHFLEDRWSAGHMWERWGAADARVFEGRGVADGLLPARLVAGIAGLLHGSQGLTNIPAPMCSPAVLGPRPYPANRVLLDAITATVAGPLPVTALQPTEWTPVGGPLAGRRFSGVGDLRWSQMLRGASTTLGVPIGQWDPRDNRPGDGQYGALWAASGPQPLFTDRQLATVNDCADRSYAAVLRALGTNPGGGFGLLGAAVPPAVGGDPEGDAACWSNWVTNASMLRAMESVHLDDLAALTRGVSFLVLRAGGPVRGLAFALDALTADFRRELTALSAQVQMEALLDPHGTTLARGERLPSLFGVRPNNAYAPDLDGLLASYVEPANLDELPHHVDPTRARMNPLAFGYPGRDKRTLFGFFHRAHADYWCGRTGYTAAPPPADYRAEPHLDADNRVDLEALRRPSAVGARVPTDTERENMDREVAVCELLTERLFARTGPPDPVGPPPVGPIPVDPPYEDYGAPLCETLARATGGAGLPDFRDARDAPALAAVLRGGAPSEPYAMPRQYAPTDLARDRLDERDDPAHLPGHRATSFHRTVVNWCERIPVIAVTQEGAGRDAIFYAHVTDPGGTTAYGQGRPMAQGATGVLRGTNFGRTGELFLYRGPDDAAPVPARVLGWTDREVRFALPATARTGAYLLRVVNRSDPMRARGSELYATLDVVGVCGDGSLCGWALAAGRFFPDASGRGCPRTGPRDLAIGAPGTAGQVGAVYVLPADATRSTEVVPVDSSLGALPAQFGHALAAADFDADGCDDLLVGTPGRPTQSGRAEILWGGATFGAVGAAARTLIGRGTEPGRGVGDQWGFAVAAGDLDGDGDRDVLVSATNSPDSRLATVRRGRVYLLPNLGGRTFGAPSLDIFCRGASFDTCPRDTQWGSTLAAGPLRPAPAGATTPDLLVVGAPLARAARWFPTPGATLRNTYEPDVGGHDGNVTGLLQRVGLAVSDFDGDGARELFLGALDVSPAGVGRVYRVRPDLGATPPTWPRIPASAAGPMSCLDGAACTVMALEGPHAGNPDQGGTRFGVRASRAFGHALAVSPLVASAGGTADEPGTGFAVIADPEAVALPPLAGGAAPAAGVAWVVHFNSAPRFLPAQGFEARFLHPVVEPRPATGPDVRALDLFGWSVTAADIEGDEEPEILVGAPGYDRRGGAVWRCPNPPRDGNAPFPCTALVFRGR